MCTQFTGKLTNKLNPYLLHDDLVRTIVDNYLTNPQLHPATVEQVIESICVAALNIRDDYFKLLLKEYERNAPIQISK